jgi:hypothetical protein
MLSRHTLLLITVALASLGCGSSTGESTSSAAAKTVMIDVATGEVITVDPAAPAGPAAARPTLRPALYCAACQKWHAAPSIEQLHRQRGVAYCPKCAGTLTANGPSPGTPQTPL